MECQILSIDSRFRSSGFPNSTSFVYTPKYPFKNIRYIRLSSIELPNIHYTFTTQRDNTSFNIVSGDNTIKITIPEGNYDSILLIDTINNIFADINSEYGTSFNITFNEISAKCTITNTETFNIDFTNSGIYECLGYHLGFENKLYVNGISLTGETVVDTMGDRYAYLKVNNYGNMHNDIISQDVLAKIIINKNKGLLIYDNEANFITKTYFFRQPENINSLKIDLLDSYGNTINLMNQNFSFTLELGQIYNADLKKIWENVGVFM